MIAQCFIKLLDKVEELQAKLVISLIGREIELHLCEGKGDHGEKLICILEMCSGVYYGRWEIKRNNGAVIEATLHSLR